VEKQREQKINRNLAVDPIEIELGVNLIELARGGVLLSKITAAREAMASELGIILPKVRVRDNLQLQPNQFQIRINHLPVCQGAVELNRVLLVKKTPAAADPVGMAGSWHSGFGAFWVEENSTSMRAREYERLSPADVVIESLKHQSRTRAAEILTRQSTAYLIDQLRESHPATVDELIPDVMRIGQVQQVLQRLLMENVSIRPLNTILEGLADWATTISDPLSLTEAVRSRLTPWITASLQSADGVIRVIDLDPTAMAWLEARVAAREEGRFLQLEISEREKIQSFFRQHTSQSRSPENPLAIRVSRTLRAALLPLLDPQTVDVAIVAPNEISQDAKIETIAILRMSDVHYVAA
ncbi:MAG: FHIPEP family type III secretion protein, partial [Planctomycetaceae bacterium]|nr:FHIPEP family type III secretion protein [Planctomycetaceae bacterium]